MLAKHSSRLLQPGHQARADCCWFAFKVPAGHRGPGGSLEVWRFGLPLPEMGAGRRARNEYSAEDLGRAQAGAGPQGYTGLRVWATPSTSLGAQFLSRCGTQSPKSRHFSALYLIPKARKPFYTCDTFLQLWCSFAFCLMSFEYILRNDHFW